MSRWSDIEDFTTLQLRQEISRREQLALQKKCWYCGKNLYAHTCKHADKKTPVPGWVVDPPHYVDSDDCMGRPEKYWRVLACHPVLNQHTSGSGDSPQEATDVCVRNILEKERQWSSSTQSPETGTSS